MYYVRTLRRIAALQRANQRAQDYLTRHNCDPAECIIVERINDEIVELQWSIYAWWWGSTEGDHALRRMREKQLSTACRLLELDWCSTLEDYRFFPA